MQAREEVGRTGSLASIPVEDEHHEAVSSMVDDEETTSLLLRTSQKASSAPIAVSASVKEIFARRYMKLDAREFETIAGTKSLRSPEYSNIIRRLNKYQSTQDIGEKEEQLQSLQGLITAYRQKKEGMREDAVDKHKMTEKEIAEIERAHRRIDACNLLERGLIVEAYHLEQRSMPYLD